MLEADKCEDICHTTGIKQLYELRKETIERIFVTTKKNMVSSIRRCMEKPGWK